MRRKPINPEMPFAVRAFGGKWNFGEMRTPFSSAIQVKQRSIKNLQRSLRKAKGLERRARLGRKLDAARAALAGLILSQ